MEAAVGEATAHCLPLGWANLTLPAAEHIWLGLIRFGLRIGLWLGWLVVVVVRRLVHLGFPLCLPCLDSRIATEVETNKKRGFEAAAVFG